jgi:UMF1 family MFS transporter
MASSAIGARPRPTRLGIGAWLLFDWAAQPYFTLVTTFVFAPFFAARVAATPVEGQALWGYATSAAGLVIALLSPILGAVADATGQRKPWITAFSILLVIGSAALWLAVPGEAHAVAIALIAFAVGTVGVEFATVFTNAMMPDLVDEDRLGRLSGTGWAVGYVGGLISLVIALGLLVADPESGRTFFGLAPILGLDPATFGGDRASGPFSAVWYVVFVLPLYLFTPDTPKRHDLGPAVRHGLAELRKTLGGLGGHRNALRYLVANMIYSDGLIALFAFGGIYAAGTFQMSFTEVLTFGIALNVTAGLGAAGFAWVDDLIGSKKTVLIALAALSVLGPRTGPGRG